MTFSFLPGENRPEKQLQEGLSFCYLPTSSPAALAIEVALQGCPEKSRDRSQTKPVPFLLLYTDVLKYNSLWTNTMSIKLAFAN